MGEISLSHGEKSALEKIDLSELRKLIDKAVEDEKLDDLCPLQLSECGLYVTKQLGYFQRALATHGKSKAAKKWAETNERFRRAGSDLLDAVRQMKRRMEEEEKDGRLFRVDDHIMHPHQFSNRLTVRVSYQWRRSVDDQWSYGSINFVHDVEMRPDYTLPAAKRKPSASQ